jgi:hypothetical protein
MEEDTGPSGQDLSLASERTELAWNRSGLAVLGVLAILVRRLWPLHGTSASVVLIVTAAGAVTWAVGMMLARRSAGPPSGLGRAHAKTLTVGTLLLAAAAFVLGMVPPT